MRNETARQQPPTGETTPFSGAPAAQGLYDPRFEHDACGVSFVVDIKGRASRDIVADGARRALQPRPPRRVGRRGQHRRRRRHPASRSPTASSARSSTSRCRRPGAYGVGLAFLPADDRGRPKAVGAIEQIVAERGPARSSAGATCPIDDSMIGPTARGVDARASGSCFVADPTAPTGIELDRKLFVRAQARRARDRGRHRRRARRLLPVAVEPHARLQGHAHHAAARASSSPTSATSASSRRSRWCTAASRPTRSRRGRSRTRTATSRTTARSTRCRATATGCGPARRC